MMPRRASSDRRIAASLARDVSSRFSISLSRSSAVAHGLDLSLQLAALFVGLAQVAFDLAQLELAIVEAAHCFRIARCNSRLLGASGQGHGEAGQRQGQSDAYGPYPVVAATRHSHRPIRKCAE